MRTWLFLLQIFVLLTTALLPVFAANDDASDTTTYTKPPVVVVAQRPMSAASDETFRSRDLDLLPRMSTQDLLRVVPGLVITQHAGGGKAEQIFLRGFDADHGTDVNINVEGAPVNMVSHGHGQGYADLHFVIPELVERIDLVKGPYFAQYGDLTTAGAVTLHLADTLPSNIAKIESGLYGFFRGLGILSSKHDATHVYVGGEIVTNSGYFDVPQGLDRVNLIGRTHTVLSKDISLTSTAMYLTSSWDASGQIPERAVGNGLISRYGSIDPNEGGQTSRTTLQIALEEKGMDPFSVRASFTDYRFQLFSNFTFFLNDSLRGDMIEQTDDRQVVTMQVQKSFSSEWGSIGAITMIGTNVRYDDIATSLFHDSARVRLSTTRGNTIDQTNIGLFAQQTVLMDDLTIILGLRGDYFRFLVADITTNADEVRGVMSTFLVSPKITLTYSLNESAMLFANSGFGFHSNDARVAVTVPNSTTVPRAFGSEIGARWADRTVALSATAWMLDLESEFVWIGDEGTTEESGRSRRVGIDLEARVQTTQWLTIGGNATFARGRMRDLAEGFDRIPLAPSITLTTFAAVSLPWMSSAVRLRHIDDRPADESNSVIASGYTIIDVTATIPVSTMISINLQCENLFNTQWRESQFDTESRLQNEPTPVSEIHYTPGTPFSLRVGVSVAGW
ncbi:MAG TPA: TonB-dependent receptor [Candidatus Didemnitutus sp.]|nr:TonB-dependent receptor [Candidatus Didemnitutus sp.]